MTEAWATTYCTVFGLFRLVQRHIVPIYACTISFLLGMIAWWYISEVLS